MSATVRTRRSLYRRHEIVVKLENINKYQFQIYLLAIAGAAILNVFSIFFYMLRIFNLYF